jgi:ribonuclease P protein component
LINSLTSQEIRSLINKPSQIFKSTSFIAYYVPSLDFKVGFSIRRLFGSAVVRNKFKRIVRSQLKRKNINSLHVFVRVVAVLGVGDDLNKELKLFFAQALKIKN